MEAILSKYESLIDSCLTKSKLKKFCEPIGWKDAVTVQVKDSYLHDRNAWSGNPQKTPEGLILRRLGHLVVNPNDLDRTTALVDSYVHSFNEAGNQSIANATPEKSQQLIEFLTMESKIQRDAIEQEQQLHTTKYMILHGERGAGKTFFLNYLLSKHSDYLDRNKVVWVRLNLVENFGTSQDLIEWIYSQEMKIICRYYDPNSSHFDSRKERLFVGKHLTSFIKARYSDDPAREKQMLDQLDAVLECFRRKENDRPLTPEFIPSILSMETHRYALQKGYSFIVVLDGLDQLELTSESEEHHRKIVEQAGHLVTSLTSMRQYYVLVSRTCSIQERGVPYVSGTERKEMVSHVSLIEIFEKRIEYLKDYFNKNSNYDPVEKKKYVSHLTEYYNYMNNIESQYNENGNIDQELLHFLDNFFGENKRAAIQSVQIYYHNFLRFKGIKTYAMTENLLKCGRAYPPKIYKYLLQKDERLIREKQDHRVFDNIFLISIFSFPTIEINHSAKVVQSNVTYIMVGLRILQLIIAFERYQRERSTDKIEDLRVGELVELIVTLFGYNDKLTLALIEEYAEVQMLEINNKSHERPKQIKNCNIRSLPKSKLLIEIYLFDIAYINLAAMRIPLPAEVLGVKLPFIKAISLDSQSTTLVEWIFWKLANAASFNRLIQFANEQQRTLVHLNKSKIKTDRMRKLLLQAETSVTPIHGGMFDVSNKLKKSLKEQSKQILGSYDISNKLASIEGYLDAFCKIWT